MPEASSAPQQRTLKRPVTIEGVGLHTGHTVTLRVMPAPVNHGLVFVRTDLPGKPALEVRSRHVTGTALATTLGCDGHTVGTVEHVLAALAGLEIDNARLEIDGPEVPIVDGSALPFAAEILEAGIRHQNEPRQCLVIKRTVTVREGEKFATFAPARRFRIDCTIDFHHPLISDQRYAFEMGPRAFVRDVAPARTFGFLRDVDQLRAMGLARGGSLSNAVVVDDFSILNPEGLRFPDEFVRHKVLDALGDVALLGHPVVGALTAYKTGHALNQKLVAQVLADSANYELVWSRGHELLAESEGEEGEGMLAPTAA